MRRAVILAGAFLLTSVVLAEPASGAMCLRWEEPDPYESTVRQVLASVGFEDL